jgi:hypothetical protein
MASFSSALPRPSTVKQKEEKEEKNKTKQKPKNRLHLKIILTGQEFHLLKKISVFQVV